MFPLYVALMVSAFLLETSLNRTITAPSLYLVALFMWNIAPIESCHKMLLFQIVRTQGGHIAQLPEAFIWSSGLRQP